MARDRFGYEGWIRERWCWERLPIWRFIPRKRRDGAELALRFSPEGQYQGAVISHQLSVISRRANREQLAASRNWVGGAGKSCRSCLIW